MQSKFRSLSFLFLIPIILFPSCARKGTIAAIQEDELFSLKYGSFEDELNMFNLGTVGNVNTSIAMCDGFFFIANGQAKKIMELNSYGDLLMLFYNADFNPKPSFVGEEDSVSATRRAVEYPFSDLSCIAVDEKKCLYAVDKLPPERQEQDVENRHVLSQIVLRFDGNGNFIDYLGQQGPGGTPFPYVCGIYATKNSELVVVTKSGEALTVFWFNSDGFPMFIVPIKKENVPNPFSEDGHDWFLTIENVIPDLEKHNLFLKVDYYTSYVDEASRVQSGIDYSSTVLYTLNVENGHYDSALDIPPYNEQVADGFSRETYLIPYDFIGVSESEWFFFLVSTEEGFSIQMVQSDGQRILKRRIPMNHKENLFYTFNLSSAGILSMLIVREDKTVIDWWRTDELILSVLKN